jgi:hypothetical protein
MSFFQRRQSFQPVEKVTFLLSFVRRAAFFTPVLTLSSWAVCSTILVVFIVPLSIGLAILRFRLYDIDLLINRTLVYGMLTVLLALIYVGFVIGFQSLVHLFTGQVSQSPVVIVASTLAIAALFQPLLFSRSSTGWKIVRRWRLGNKIEKIVDRKYKYRLI